jgi:serine/threonine-protein kinase RsbW
MYMEGLHLHVQCKAHGATNGAEYYKITIAGIRYITDMVESLLRDNGVPDHDVFGIRLSMEEAGVNAMLHGNLATGSALREDRHMLHAHLQSITSPDILERICTVRITVGQLDAESKLLEIAIVDEGSGFNIEDVPDPRAEENLEAVSGRGLLLMSTFMDDVRYVGTGNQVIMKKILPHTTPASQTV